MRRRARKIFHRWFAYFQRKARRCWSSMADANLEKNVEFAINWNCTPLGQQLRRRQLESAVEDTKAEKDALEEGKFELTPLCPQVLVQMPKMVIHLS